MLAESASPLTFIASQAAGTIIGIVTSAALGGGLWLCLLHWRSAQLRRLLSNSHRSFNLHFRGDEKPEKVKTIHFLPDGRIAEPNGNEDYWEVSCGTLTILTRNRKPFSKFKWDRDKGRLVHTNDPNLPSVMGQYIVPSTIPADKQSQIYSKEQ